MRSAVVGVALGSAFEPWPSAPDWSDSATESAFSKAFSLGSSPCRPTRISATTTVFVRSGRKSGCCFVVPESGGMSTLYKQLLLFPERAENLGQFSEYDVDLEHWKGLSAVFRATFQGVYERGASAILLVHGAQGTGKTLFSRRLEQDFNKASGGAVVPEATNLWHTLVGDNPATKETIEKATIGSLVQRVEPASGWLEKLRARSMGRVVYGSASTSSTTLRRTSSSASGQA